MLILDGLFLKTYERFSWSFLKFVLLVKNNNNNIEYAKLSKTHINHSHDGKQMEKLLFVKCGHHILF